MKNNRKYKLNNLIKLLLIAAAFVALFFVDRGFYRTARADVSGNSVSGNAKVTITAKCSVSYDQLQDQQFNFELLEYNSVSDDSISETFVSNASNDQNGDIIFPEITYDSAGTHNYEIVQVLPEGVSAEHNYTFQGIKYDNSVFHIEVNVSENDGTLSASVNGELPEFRNSFEAYGDFSLTGKLILEGGTIEENGQYRIKVTRIEDGQEVSDNTVSVEKDGTWKTGAAHPFNDIDASDLFNNKQLMFRFTQEKTNVPGVVYDEKSYYVHLTLSKSGDYWSDREAKIDISKDINDDEIIFKNTIEKKSSSITDANVTLSQTEFVYTGSEIKPGVIVTLSGNRLVEGTDYTVSYRNNINVGTKISATASSEISVSNAPTVIITGTGRYTGEVNETFTISERSITDAVFLLSQSEYEYTGKAIEPNVMVTLGDKTLIEGIDYIVSYVNNINVASMKASKNPPTVIITGIGNYTGETFETFTISVTDITKKNDKSEYFCKITFDKVSYVYNGSECKPSPKVTMNGVTLKKDTDYTVSYSNNIDVGAKGSTNSYPIATIKGKGIYTGTRAFSFKITARSLKDAVINLDKGKTVNYTGNEINNPISSVTLSGKTLKEGTDYEVDSSSRLKATASGSYSVKINGKGNYNESASTTWSIRNTTSTSTTTSGTNTNSSNSGSDYVSTKTNRSSSSSTKPSGTTTGSNTSKTASGNSVSGNKTGKATTGGSSSSSAGGRSVSGNAAGRDAADTVESTGSVSDDSVSANTFPDGEIKKESYGNSGGLKKFTYDGSRNGVIENILTPAPGYENDPPVTGAVDDIAAVGEALMAGDFKEAVEDGAELEVWVDVQPAEDTVSEEEKSLAEKYIMSITDKVAGLCIGRYLDVNVFFRVDRGVWEEVEKTNVPIAVDFSAPDSMKAQSDRFYVLCIHDGKVELLSDINSDPDMITVMTQWLQATYVLLYQDVDAAAAGEIYGPSQASFYTEHDSFDFTAKAADKPKHTPPKFLAISWFMSSFLVLGGYGIYEALKDKEAFKAMLDSLPKRRQTSKTA